MGHWVRRAFSIVFFLPMSAHASNGDFEEIVNRWPSNQEVLERFSQTKFREGVWTDYEERQKLKLALTDCNVLMRLCGEISPDIVPDFVFGLSMVSINTFLLYLKILDQENHDG